MGRCLSAVAGRAREAMAKSEISPSLIEKRGVGVGHPPLPSGCCVPDEGEGESDEAGAPC